MREFWVRSPIHMLLATLRCAHAREGLCHAGTYIPPSPYICFLLLCAFAAATHALQDYIPPFLFTLRTRGSLATMHPGQRSHAFKTLQPHHLCPPPPCTPSGSQRRCSLLCVAQSRSARPASHGQCTASSSELASSACSPRGRASEVPSVARTRTSQWGSSPGCVVGSSRTIRNGAGMLSAELSLSDVRSGRHRTAA